jgi:hypothetical protein
MFGAPLLDKTNLVSTLILAIRECVQRDKAQGL